LTTYKVPNSLADAQQELGALGRLLVATEWERAASVYAFTTDGVGGPRVPNAGQSPLSIRAFAELGITGLGSTGSVTFYRNQWKRAMAAGSPAAKPGKKVTLPTIEWDEHEDRDRNRRYVERSEDAVARSLDRRDLDADSLAQRMSDEVAEQVVARFMEDRPETVYRAVRQTADVQTPVARHVGDKDEYDAVGRSIDDDRVAASLGNAVFVFARQVQAAVDDRTRGGKARREKLAAQGGHHAEVLGTALDVLRGLSDADLMALLEQES
jgi:hypothetical protein